MKILVMTMLLATFGFSQAGHSAVEVDKKPPVRKCPKGQHWDAGMKMCMRN